MCLPLYVFPLFLTGDLLMTNNLKLKIEDFENRVFRRTFRTKRDEVTGGFRKLHNEEDQNLRSSPHIK